MICCVCWFFLVDLLCLFLANAFRRLFWVLIRYKLICCLSGFFVYLCLFHSIQADLSCLLICQQCLELHFYVFKCIECNMSFLLLLQKFCFKFHCKLSIFAKSSVLVFSGVFRGYKMGTWSRNALVNWRPIFLLYKN